MSTPYEWLYDSYAKDTLDRIKKSGDSAVEELVRELDLTQEERYHMRETLEYLQLGWGAEVFALGLQLGMRLMLPEA